MIRFLISKAKQLLGINDIQQNQRQMLNLLGKLMSSLNSKKNFKDINDYEFKVFSQFGDDGIIQYLIQNIDIKNKFFLEFGVENYEEANTRFLLESNNWAGMVIDSSEKNISYIKNQYYYWKFNLNAFCHFITKENINEILKKNINKPEIGILSIDVDGNDYWIWKEINYLKPQIVIIEYNARFGDERSVTIPYEQNFNRSDKKYNNIYYGASLQALTNLANKKNYSLIGTNLNGNNAYFINNKYLPQNSEIIKSVDVKKCFKKNSFKENRNASGNIIFISTEEENKILKKFNLEEV